MPAPDCVKEPSAETTFEGANVKVPLLFNTTTPADVVVTLPVKVMALAVRLTPVAVLVAISPWKRERPEVAAVVCWSDAAVIAFVLT